MPNKAPPAGETAGQPAGGARRQLRGVVGRTLLAAADRLPLPPESPGDRSPCENGLKRQTPLRKTEGVLQKRPKTSGRSTNLPVSGTKKAASSAAKGGVGRKLSLTAWRNGLARLWGAEPCRRNCRDRRGHRPGAWRGLEPCGHTTKSRLQCRPPQTGR